MLALKYAKEHELSVVHLMGCRYLKFLGALNVLTLVVLKFADESYPLGLGAQNPRET